MNEKELLALLAPLKEAMQKGPRGHCGKHAELRRRMNRGKLGWSAGYSWYRQLSNSFSGAVQTRWLGHGSTPEAAVNAAVAKLNKVAP